MRVVDDRSEHLAALVLLVGLLDEPPLALEVAPVGLDLEGLAHDAEDGVVGVQGPIDDRSEQPLRVMRAEGLLDDGLSGAGLADDQA